MVPQNSPEDNEASSSQSAECASASNCCPQQPTLAQCNHLLNKEENVSNARRASTSVPNSESYSSQISQSKHVNLRRESGMNLPSSLKGKPAAGAPETMPSNSPSWLTAELEESIRNHPSPEDSLQWLQALKLQAVGACRSDERLRPLLRWNVSCFGSDGRLLAHLGQHFKARELALLARCLCTPVVSLRVGKVSRHGQYLYPTATRGYLNLMLLPCSEMRLSFADDVGTVERVAITMPGVESGGILIEELQEDSSRRTFVVKDRCGNNRNYFWQSEKLKSSGDELITKIRNMLKRRPTLAHLTGIDEGRLDSFADYLRTAIFSKASKALSQLSATQPVPSLEAHEESSIITRRPFRRSLLKLATFSLFSSPTHFENQISPPIESSMDKLQRCMQEIHASVRFERSSLASSLPALDKLLESLKKLQDCLHSLITKRTGKLALPQVDTTVSLLVNSNSSIKPDSENRLMKLVKFITESILPFEEKYHYLPRTISFPVRTQLPVKIMRESPSPCVSGTIQALESSTVVYHDLGSTLDSARRKYRSLTLKGHTKPLRLSFEGIKGKTSDFLNQKLYGLSLRKAEEKARLNSLVVPDLVDCGAHEGDVDVDINQLLVWPAGDQTLSNMLTQLVSQVPRMVACLSNETVRTHNLYVIPGVMAHAGASAGARWSVLPLAIEHGPAPNSSGACPRCGPGTSGLGNLVLVTVSAQQTGPRLRVVTTEITSGNVSYIVRFLQSF